MTVPLGALPHGAEMNPALIYQQVISPYNQALAAMNADDTGWVPLALVGGWTKYSSMFAAPAYRRIGKQTMLQGLIAGGAIGNVATISDPASQPTLQCVFLCNASAGAVRIDVSSAGVISVQSYEFGGVNASVSLTGIRFFAD